MNGLQHGDADEASHSNGAVRDHQGTRSAVAVLLRLCS